MFRRHEINELSPKRRNRMARLYKGFDRFETDEKGQYGVTCRSGKLTKYYQGETVYADDCLPPRLCTAGVVHACRKPIDVLNYYSNHAYAIVKGDVVVEEPGKAGCRSLTVERFLSLNEFVQLIVSTSTSYNSPTTGHSSPTTGDESPTTGGRSPTTGNNSPTTGLASSTVGNRSPTTGYGSPTSGHISPTGGDESPTTGHSSPTAGHRSPTTGDESPTTGRESPTIGYSSDVSGGPISAALGRGSKVLAPEVGMALMCAEWKNGELLSVAAGMVDGEKIKTNTWYICRNGQLVEHIEEE
jgi:hypothetical protein